MHSPDDILLTPTTKPKGYSASRRRKYMEKGLFECTICTSLLKFVWSEWTIACCKIVHLVTVCAL